MFEVRIFVSSQADLQLAGLRELAGVHHAGMVGAPWVEDRPETAGQTRSYTLRFESFELWAAYFSSAPELFLLMPRGYQGVHVPIAHKHRLWRAETEDAFLCDCGFKVSGETAEAVREAIKKRTP